jgi:nucleotide-binding universal stress UspA family protein
MFCHEEGRMFRKILMPLDLTDKHKKALDTAAELAGSGGEITLVHVIELIHGVSVEEEKDFYDRLEQAAREQLARYAAVLGSRQVPCRQEILFGGRALEIVRLARESGTDLIVLTAPAAEPGQPDVGLGSLSYKVGVFAPCPVLLVR